MSGKDEVLGSVTGKGGRGTKDGEDGPVELADGLEVVEDPGVGAGSLDIGLQGTGLEGGIGAVDDPFAGGIADRGFVKTEVVGEDFGDFGADGFVLSAQLTAQ